MRYREFKINEVQGEYCTEPGQKNSIAQRIPPKFLDFPNRLLIFPNVFHIPGCCCNENCTVNFQGENKIDQIYCSIKSVEHWHFAHLKNELNPRRVLW